MCKTWAEVVEKIKEEERWKEKKKAILWRILDSYWFWHMNVEDPEILLEILLDVIEEYNEAMKSIEQKQNVERKVGSHI